MCVWLWLGGGVYHTLTMHSIRCLFKTSSQSAHQFTASWHAQVLVATGHGIAGGKPSRIRLRGYPRDRNSVKKIRDLTIKSRLRWQIRLKQHRREVIMPNFDRTERKDVGCGYLSELTLESGGCSRLSYVSVNQWFWANVKRVSRNETDSRLVCSRVTVRNRGWIPRTPAGLGGLSYKY